MLEKNLSLGLVIVFSISYGMEVMDLCLFCRVHEYRFLMDKYN